MTKHEWRMTKEWRSLNEELILMLVLVLVIGLRIEGETWLVNGGQLGRRGKQKYKATLNAQRPTSNAECWIKNEGARGKGSRHGGFVIRRAGSLFQSKLLANRLRESVFYLCVPWDRHRPAIYRICIKIMVRTVTLQITAAFSETSYELSPLHNEIAISCLSFGTNVLSAASSTISR